MKESDLLELSQTNMRHFAWAFFVDWSVIIFTVALAMHFNSVLGYLIAVLIVGSRQHALQALGHDAAHLASTHKKSLYRTLTQICFMPFSLNADLYMKFHMGHHQQVSTKEDPEIKIVFEHSPNAWRFLTPGKRIRLVLLDFVGGSLVDVFFLIKNMFSFKPKDLAVTGIFWGLVFLVFPLPAILLWFYSMVSFGYSCTRMRAWLEHTNTWETHRYKLPKLWALFVVPHNIGFHYEHHKWPFIPYYNLPRARELYQEEPILSWNEVHEKIKGPSCRVPVQAG